MTYKELLDAARPRMGAVCKACPVCDGRACGNRIPGPGAKGVGDTAIRNYQAWQNVRLNMDAMHEGFEPDTTLQLFGRNFRIPVFAGPVGAVTNHYRLGGLKQYKFIFSCSSRGQKSEIKVSAQANSLQRL